MSSNICLFVSSLPMTGSRPPRSVHVATADAKVVLRPVKVYPHVGRGGGAGGKLGGVGGDGQAGMEGGGRGGDGGDGAGGGGGGRRGLSGGRGLGGGGDGEGGGGAGGDGGGRGSGGGMGGAGGDGGGDRQGTVTVCIAPSTLVQKLPPSMLIATSWRTAPTVASTTVGTSVGCSQVMVDSSMNVAGNGGYEPTRHFRSSSAS